MKLALEVVGLLGWVIIDLDFTIGKNGLGFGPLVIVSSSLDFLILGYLSSIAVLNGLTFTFPPNREMGVGTSKCPMIFSS